MLKLLFNPPRDQHFILACSGGVDSMAALDFFARGGKKFTVAYFNHGTLQSGEMQSFLAGYCKKRSLNFAFGELTKDKPKEKSIEEFWRDERYKWLNWLANLYTQNSRGFCYSYPVNNYPIITAHHLNDAMETWLFTSMHGQGKLIPVQNGTVIHPFLLNEKEEMIYWCKQHDVPWVEDKSNEDVSSPRNRIRHNILPEVLKINPGFAKVIKKKYLNEE